MFGKNDPEKQLFFRKPFSEKYTLTIKADVLAGSMPIKTTTEIRWDLRVLKVTGEEAEIELITLGQELLQTNNPALKELARMNQAFAKMYSEIHAVIDRSGKVQRILNESVIKRKWASVKAEMEEIEEQSDAIRGIILMNDEIFNSGAQILKAVQNNEFFGIYFHYVYGTRLPGDATADTCWNHFQQAQVNWGYNIRASHTLPVAPHVQAVTVEVTGTPLTELNTAWVKKAYGAFQQVDISQVKPKLSETGRYAIEPATGRLKEAWLVKEEIADQRFIFSRLEYELKGSGTGQQA